MTISVDSNVKANQKMSSSCSAAKHSVRHGKKVSKAAFSFGKAKSGWMGAVLRRGHGGTGCSPSIGGQH